MSMKSLGYGAAVCLAALLAGCSSTSSSSSSVQERRASASAYSASRVSDECKPKRSSCLYNGSYESGERGYAEDEAKRLNLAEVERLRRAFGQ